MTMPKSPEEVRKLKENWRRDPCWDIEDTEGFEDYREELLQYRLNVEAERKQKAKEEHDRLASFVCPMTFKWVDYGRDDRGFTYQNCLVENCAWWDGKQCAVKMLTALSRTGYSMIP